MLRRLTVTAVSALGLLASPTAAARPAPELGAPCGDPATATVAADGVTVLRCDGVWRGDEDPAVFTDRWLGWGPPLELRGQGRRAPQIRSGRWEGVPTDAGATCTAQQRAVAVDATPGNLAAPTSDAASPGRPLDVRLDPRLFTVVLGGDCTWRLVAADG